MIIIRLFKFIVFLAFLGAAGVFIYLSINAPAYQSSFSVVLSDSDKTDQALYLTEPYIESENFKKIVEKSFAENTGEEIKYSRDQWKNKFYVNLNREAKIAQVIVTGNDSQRTFKLATETAINFNGKLSNIIQAENLKTEIISGPNETSDFNYINLAPKLLWGVYGGGFIAIFLWALFGGRADSLLYSKKTRRKSRKSKDLGKTVSSQPQTAPEIKETKPKDNSKVSQPKAYEPNAQFNPAQQNVFSNSNPAGTEKNQKIYNEPSFNPVAEESFVEPKAAVKEPEKATQETNYTELYEPEEDYSDPNSIISIRKKMNETRSSQAKSHPKSFESNQNGSYDNERIKERLNRLIND